MKKIIALFLLSFVLIVSVCAEKFTFHTGEAFGFSNADYFFPLDIAFTATKCTVTSVKKIDSNLWCLMIVAPKSMNTNAPISFEFFVKKGDVLKMRRLSNPMIVCNLKVADVNWNEISFETE